MQPQRRVNCLPPGRHYSKVADTNGDGIPDLIADAQGYIVVTFSNGDGTFGPAGSLQRGIQIARHALRWLTEPFSRRTAAAHFHQAAPTRTPSWGGRIQYTD